MSSAKSSELGQLWNSLPNRTAFAVLFSGWILLFHFLGNSTLGYVNTPSVFGWLNALYNRDSVNESGDELCPLIPFVTLGLLYLKRIELTNAMKGPWRAALAMLALASLLHVAGYVIQQTRISLVAFILGGFAVMGLFWGRQWLRLTFFPWFLLLAAIPFSSYLDSITFGLRLLSSKVSVAICRNLLGMDLIRQETLVSMAPSSHSAGFHFEVAAACSGMRSLTAVVLISTLFAYLNFQSIWRRLAIVVASLPLALAGNIFRLCVVFVVGDAFGENAGKFVETKMGFITWIAALLGLFQLGRWLRETTPMQAEKSMASDTPLLEIPIQSPGLHPVFPGLCAGIILSAVALILHVRENQTVGKPYVRVEGVPLISESGRTVRTNSVHLPLVVPGYSAQIVPVTDLEVDYLPPDTVFGRASYISSDRQLGVLASVVLMGTDRTSIHRPEYCLTSQGWEIRQQTLQNIPLDAEGHRQLEVQRFYGRMSGVDSNGKYVEKSGVYVFWFAADGQLTAKHSVRQWSMIKGLLFENLVQRWAYISFFAECLPGQEDVCYKRLNDLIRLTAPSILSDSALPLIKPVAAMNATAH